MAAVGGSLETPINDHSEPPFPESSKAAAAALLWCTAFVQWFVIFHLPCLSGVHTL
jgi:hypothetical protein